MRTQIENPNPTPHQKTAPTTKATMVPSGEIATAAESGGYKRSFAGGRMDRRELTAEGDPDCDGQNT